MFIWRVLRTKVKLTGMVSCINMKSVSGWYQYSQLIWLIRVADNFIWLYCIFICIVDFGDNGVHTDLIYLDNFWSENVIYDEYYFCW